MSLSNRDFAITKLALELLIKTIRKNPELNTLKITEPEVLLVYLKLSNANPDAISAVEEKIKMDGAQIIADSELERILKTIRNK